MPYDNEDDIYGGPDDTTPQEDNEGADDGEYPQEDTGHYYGGYRTYRNGTCREDFGSDR